MILKLLSIAFYYLGFGILYALYREYIIHQSLKNEDYKRLQRMFNSQIHNILGKVFCCIIRIKLRIDEALDNEL